MHKRTLNTFLSRGFPTDLIEKIDNFSLTYSALNGIPLEALMKLGFEEEEANVIYEKTGRKPIKKEVRKSLIEKSGECCCYCKNGINTQPYQIHHIEEYHVNQNNEESNLLVVCPTHHVAIHSKTISETEQIIRKNEWENLWLIAKEYNNKQLSYPFKSFSIIDYTKEGTMDEIFSFSVPTGNLCELLTTGDLVDSAYDILLNTNMLILTGDSGSGKSTFALGIGGKFKKYTVLKYEPKKVNNIEEILNLISLNVKNTILIIDDANLCFSSNEIENILNATNESFKIIITFTTGTVNEQVKNHFPHNTIFLSWSALEIGCKQYFLNNEEVLIHYLNENNINNFDNDIIGFSFPFITLQNLFDRFSNRIDNVKTAWEFIYLLSNGHSKIDNISNKLFSDDRLDIVVYFCSVIQIANIDSGATINEIQAFYRENNILNQSPEPEQEWLLNVLEGLCNERVLKSDRGRYKTIHRKFAQNFIDSFSLKYSKDAENVLIPYLEAQKNAKPVVILWSWLKSTSAKFIIYKWLKSKDSNFHITFISKCAKEDFAILSIFTTLIEPTIRQDKEFAENIFKSNIAEITDSINGYNKPYFYYHNNFYRILKQNISPIAEQICKNIDINIFTNNIKNAEANEYYHLNWLFNSLIDINSEKVVEIGKKFSFSDCLNVLYKVETGNVTIIDEVISFYRKYFLHFKRGDLHKCIQVLIEKISNASYADLKFPHFFSGLFELPYMKVEMISILEKLDNKRLTEELISCNPRDWNNIGTFFLYVNMYYPEYSEKFVDLIDLNKLGDNISKYYKLDRYNFRCFLHFLGYSSLQKKKDFSKILVPYIEDLLTDSQNKHELKEILEAFYKIDKIESGRLSTEFQISISPKENKKGKLPDLNDTFVPDNLKTDYFLDDIRIIKE